jgi:hypothetical protein
MADHECPKSIVRCQKCDNDVIREEFATHPCLENIKKDLMEIRKIDNKDEANKVYMNKLLSLEESTVPVVELSELIQFEPKFLYNKVN